MRPVAERRRAIAQRLTYDGVGPDIFNCSAAAYDDVACGRDTIASAARTALQIRSGLGDRACAAAKGAASVHTPTRSASASDDMWRRLRRHGGGGRGARRDFCVVCAAARHTPLSNDAATDGVAVSSSVLSHYVCSRPSDYSSRDHRSEHVRTQ